MVYSISCSLMSYTLGTDNVEEIKYYETNNNGTILYQIIFKDDDRLLFVGSTEWKVEKAPTKQ